MNTFNFTHTIPDVLGYCFRIIPTSWLHQWSQSSSSRTLRRLARWGMGNLTL